MSNLIKEAIIDAESLKESAISSIKEEVLEYLTPQVKKTISNLMENHNIVSEAEMDIDDDTDEEEIPVDDKPAEDAVADDTEVGDAGEGDVDDTEPVDTEPLSTDDLSDADNADENPEEAPEDDEHAHTEDEYTEEDFDAEFGDGNEVAVYDGDQEGDDVPDEDGDMDSPVDAHEEDATEEEPDGDDDDFNFEIEDDTDVADDGAGILEDEDEDELEENMYMESRKPIIKKRIAEALKNIDSKKSKSNKTISESKDKQRIKELESGIKTLQEHIQSINIFQTKMNYVRKLLKENFNNASKKTTERILDEFDKVSTKKQIEETYNKFVQISKNKITESKKQTAKQAPAKSKSKHKINNAKNTVTEGLVEAMRSRQPLGDTPIVNTNHEINDTQLAEQFAEFSRIAGIKPKNLNG